MTSYRAPSPVMLEISGMNEDGLNTANGPHRTCRGSDPHPSPPAGAGPGFPTSQPAISCALSPQAESVKVGRDFTRAALRKWGMADLTDVAELVVSELVTNALRHGIPSASTPTAEHHVRLRLLAQHPFVMCMVTDPGSDIPVLRESGPSAESGRGLHVVDGCSVRWGWHLLDEGGKIVWAVLRPSP